MTVNVVVCTTHGSHWAVSEVIEKMIFSTDRIFFLEQPIITNLPCCLIRDNWSGTCSEQGLALPHPVLRKVNLISFKHSSHFSSETFEVKENFNASNFSLRLEDFHLEKCHIIKIRGKWNFYIFQKERVFPETSRDVMMMSSVTCWHMPIRIFFLPCTFCLDFMFIAF